MAVKPFFMFNCSLNVSIIIDDVVDKHTKCTYSAFLVLGCKKCRFERLEVHQPAYGIYSKKINNLMPKVHKTCIYSKKNMAGKNHQTCIYYFLSICRLFCPFGIKMLIFFEHMQVLWTLVKIMHLVSHAGFGEVQVTKPADGMQF